MNIKHTETVIEYLVIKKGRYLVEKSLYEDIQRQVKEIMPALETGAHYSLQDLVGDDYWFALDNTHKRQAGRCMVDMVENEQLPLEFAGHPCKSPKKYRLN